MGLEVIPPEDDGPAIFSGEAIYLEFPEITIMGTSKRGLPQPQKYRPHTIAFPHWKYRVSLNNKDYDIRGKDLQSGMPLKVGDEYLVISTLDNKQLFHGLEIDDLKCGEPARDKIPELEIKRKYFDDGHLEWEVSQKS